MAAEESYVSRQGEDEELPLRWSAPEVLISRQHSTASDVWALGVLFWEIYSHAKTPYGALSMVELGRELNSGFRLPKPTQCRQGELRPRRSLPALAPVAAWALAFPWCSSLYTARPRRSLPALVPVAAWALAIPWCSSLYTARALDMYDVMLSCWQTVAAERPPAAAVETRLLRLAGVDGAGAAPPSGGGTPLGMSANPLLHMDGLQRGAAEEESVL